MPFRNILKDPKIGLPGMVDFLVNNQIELVEFNNPLITLKGFHDTVQTFMDHSITPIQLTIDGENFFQKTDAGRKEQMNFMKPWIDAAHAENIPLIRGKMGDRTSILFRNDTKANLIATFTPILEYTESLGMKFLFENHLGKSSDINFQLEIEKSLSFFQFWLSLRLW